MLRRLWVGAAMSFLIFGLMATAGCSKKMVQSEGPAMTQAGQGTEDQQAAERARQEELARQRQIEEQRLQEEAANKEQEKDAARRMFENEAIYFDFDNSTLTAEAQDILRSKAEWLREHPNATVLIEGHCDERGTDAYNLALGDSRAEAAKAFLANLGIAPNRLATISYGEERPADPGHSEEAWTKNRRAEFVVR